MNWDAIGAMAELLGGLATVATLVYLARQIRENGRSTRLAAMQTAMLAEQTAMGIPARDRKLARAIPIAAGITDGTLTEEEHQQFRFWLFLMLRSHENMFVQHQAGMIDDETWAARSSTTLFLLSSPVGRRIWEGASNAYRADYQAWVASSQTGKDAPAV
jgi:hypothetical protein